MTLRDTIVLRHSDNRTVRSRVAAFRITSGRLPFHRTADLPGFRPSRTTSSAAGCATASVEFENTSRHQFTARPGGRVRDYAARIDTTTRALRALPFMTVSACTCRRAEASREVAVVDAHGGWEIFRINTGRAPQGLALSVDGRTLYVSNFMDRTVSVFDVSALLAEGIANVPLVATMLAVGTTSSARRC